MKQNYYAYDPWKVKWYKTDKNGYLLAKLRMRIWQQEREEEYLKRVWGIGRI